MHQKITQLLVSLTLLLPAVFAMGAYQKLEAIVAVVDEDVVLASELTSRLEAVRKSIAAGNTQLPSNEVLINQLIERLIIENIQLQEAERRGLIIDQETLAQTVNRFAADNNMNMEQFTQALAADGVSFNQFREDIRTELTITRLQRAMINRRISITEQDIEALLNSPFYQQMLSDEYRVGHIMLTVEAGASDSVRSIAVEEAQTLVTELRDGADFAQMAIAKSSATTALEGGNLGWRKAGELPTIFSDAVIELQVGDVAEPIVTNSSIHVIKLLEQRGAGMERSSQTKVRHILIRPSEIRTEEEAKAIAADLHQQLTNGADFDALAKENSEDPGSALNGGSLGWASGDQFVPIFTQVMDATDIGGLSEPFSSQFGWHILNVEDRREQDMSEEARRNMAADLLFRRRFEEERQEWLKEIRDEAFVELRL